MITAAQNEIVGTTLTLLAISVVSTVRRTAARFALTSTVTAGERPALRPVKKAMLERVLLICLDW